MRGVDQSAVVGNEVRSQHATAAADLGEARSKTHTTARLKQLAFVRQRTGRNRLHFCAPSSSSPSAPSSHSNQVQDKSDVIAASGSTAELVGVSHASGVMLDFSLSGGWALGHGLVGTGGCTRLGSRCWISNLRPAGRWLLAAGMDGLPKLPALPIAPQAAL